MDDQMKVSADTAKSVNFKTLISILKGKDKE
jgi:hypothetical protein